MSIAYRIHDAAEPLETLLDPTRPDGWVASDESADTQPLGISCCTSLGDLARYAVYYSMASSRPSLLVELHGEISGDDRDRYAARMVVRSYRVIGHGHRFIRAAQKCEPGAKAEWS